LYGPEVPGNQRRKWLLTLGFISIALFVILRLINVYGDPAPWQMQHNLEMTALSFINVTKYPLSLQFALVTLGPLLILLSVLETRNEKILKPFLTIGRVPLFYFIGHFLLAHSIALALLIWREGILFSSVDFHFAKSFGGITPGSG